MCHLDAVWPASRHAGFHRGADVVDVHVDVPGRPATDNEQTVTQLRKRGLEGSDGGWCSVEEVHDLERRTLRVVRLGQLRRRKRCLNLTSRGATRDHRHERVEQYAETSPASVDDARSG